MFHRWRELLSERLDEAAAAIGAIPGVDGLVVSGSVGRGDPWPMSDVDLLPIRTAESSEEVERLRAMLVGRWAASGREQSLDVGWLAFTREEAEAAVGSGPRGTAARMADRRWFHGLDKAYGGYGLSDPLGLASAFARWATAVRFEPEVVAARAAQWRRLAREARDRARAAAASGDRVEATVRLRESASALTMVAVEGWGERLGSMSRAWTHFERMSGRHDAAALARRLAFAADAEPEQMRSVPEVAPTWLRERCDRALAARRLIGEPVTPEENARDQIVAFRTLVTRHSPHETGEWLSVPDPLLGARLDALDSLLDELCPRGC